LICESNAPLFALVFNFAHLNFTGLI